MSLTNLEKETIILFNEAENTAEIDTFSVRLLGQLRKVAGCDGVICKKDQNGRGVYIIPKTMIKIRKPRQLNEEQLAELSERGRRNREEQLRRKANTL